LNCQLSNALFNSMARSFPNEMRAVWYEQSGTAQEVLKFGSLPTPTRKKGEVLVEVHFSSVNPVDFKLRKDMSPGCKFIPSADLSGIVVDADDSCAFCAGDRVFALIDMLGSVATSVGKVHYGGCAEYVAVPERHLARVPEEVSLEEAAGVPLVALTALQNLKKAGLVESGSGAGRHLLVLAGAGGVGNWAIQLGKVTGCEVTATASSHNHQFLKLLGADRCIDYNTEDWVGQVKALQKVPDSVFDLMGGDDELRSLRLLPRSGHYMNIMNSGWVTKYGKPGFIVTMAMVAMYRGLLQHVIGPNYYFTIVAPNGQQLGHIADLMASGQCKPVVDSVHDLPQLAIAHDKVEGGHCRGKVIIRVKDAIPQSRL